MKTKSTRDVAHILHMHPSRIEQWISRGQFLPTIFAEKGRAREWTLDEAIRLALFVHLVDLVGMDPKVAGDLTRGRFSGFKDAAAFFVAYLANRDASPAWWGSTIVSAPDLGAFLTETCPLPALAFEAATVGAADAAVVVNLDQIEAELSEAWEA